MITKIVRGSIFIRKDGREYCIDGELLGDGEISLCAASIWDVNARDLTHVKEAAMRSELVHLAIDLLAELGIKGSTWPISSTMITTITPHYIEFTIDGTEHRVDVETSERNVLFVCESSVRVKADNGYSDVPKGEERDAILSELKKLSEAEKMPLGFQ